MNITPKSALGHTFGQINSLPLSTKSNVICKEHANIGCVLLSAAIDGAEIAVKAKNCLGYTFPLSAGKTIRSDDLIYIWLSPRSWLLLCNPEDEAKICANVLAEFPDSLLHANPFTDYLCWIGLYGDQSEDLIRQGSFIDLSKPELPVGHAKRTLVNDTAAILYREKSDSWFIGIERSRALYFYQWLNNLEFI